MKIDIRNIQKLENNLCLKCKYIGSCCRKGVWVDLEEAKKIADLELYGEFHYLEKDKDFPSGYKVGTKDYTNNEKCSFLCVDGLCAIHKIDPKLKPSYCKEFPYEDGKLIPRAKELCCLL